MNVSVFALNINRKLEIEYYHKLLSAVDKDKRDRILAFRKWQDGHLTLFSDLIIRLLLIKGGMTNNEIHYMIPEYGKPVIKDISGFHFNVSHSGEWIVCVIADREVGIDVEEITAIDLSIADSFFCAKERDDILSNSDPVVRFFDYWTLKESYVKFIGQGLSIPLNEFCITFSADNKIHVEIEDTIDKAVHFRQYPFAPGYKMAVCSSTAHLPKEYTVFSMEEVVAMFI